MEAKKMFCGLRAYMAFVVVLLLMVSCQPDTLTPDPVITYTKPVVVIKAAEKVTKTTATLVARLVANESGASVSFEYKNDNTGWASKELSLTFSGKDSVTVTFDLSDLKSGTEYSFRVKAKNVAGEVTSSESKFVTYSVNDFDGNLYHTVTIGSQTWLQENFKGTHYANGDAIANVTDTTIWKNLTTSAYCYYNNDSKLGEVYGGLYNFYVGTDPRGLIIGWHVPTDDEWHKLVLYLDGNKPANYVTGLIAGPKVMETGNSHWKTTRLEATNTSGFTALPGGAFGKDMFTNKYVFMNLGEDAAFWSVTIFGSAMATDISKDRCVLETGLGFPKILGLSLRLLKN